MAPHLHTALVLDALEFALHQRQPAAGLILHSDHGAQYTSLAFGQRLCDAGLMPSMGAVGDCYDNALAQSFFATLECELITRRCWQNHTVAPMDVFDYLEAFYNPWRRHAALGQLSPAANERRWQRTTTAQIP
jgi:putative transposase